MPVPVRRTAGVPHPASPAPGLISGGVVPAGWIGVSVGSGAAAAAVAERDALGTSARVAAWPPDGLAAALAAVDAELDRLDRQASRFRADSELSRIHRAPGPVHQVSDGLAEAIRVALAAARWTGGLTDPTVGGALIALGYDRDFAAIRPGTRPPLAGPGPAPGWRSVALDRTVPAATGCPAGTRWTSAGGVTETWPPRCRSWPGNPACRPARSPCSASPWAVSRPWPRWGLTRGSRAVVAEGAEGAEGQQYADRGWRPHDITGIIDRGVDWVQYTAAGLISGAPRPMSIPDDIRAAIPRPVLIIADGAVASEPVAAR